jgi:hypothetical protein
VFGKRVGLDTVVDVDWCEKKKKKKKKKGKNVWYGKMKKWYRKVKKFYFVVFVYLNNNNIKSKKVGIF